MNQDRPGKDNLVSKTAHFPADFSYLSRTLIKMFWVIRKSVNWYKLRFCYMITNKILWIECYVFFFDPRHCHIALLGNKKTGVNSKTGNAEYLFYFLKLIKLNVFLTLVKYRTNMLGMMVSVNFPVHFSWSCIHKIERR